MNSRGHALGVAHLLNRHIQNQQPPPALGIPWAVRTIPPGRSSQHRLSHPTPSLVVPTVWDHWIGAGEHWPVPTGITSDGGILCPAGRGGDAHHHVLPCPPHLQEERGHGLGEAGHGATDISHFGDICRLCHQGGQHRAGLVP